MNQPVKSINCPICGQDCTHSSDPGTNDTIIFNCPTCGKYGITRPAQLDMRNIQTLDKAKLSAYLREREIQKQPTITIVLRTDLESSSDSPIIAIEDVINGRFPILISDRLDRTLINIQRMTTYPGELILFKLDNDYPVFFAENQNAMLFFAKTLAEKEWITFMKTPDARAIAITLMERGWLRIAELEKSQPTKESRQAFVAMWFDRSLDLAWEEGFQKAIEATGYLPFRIDLKEHNEKICDSIIGEIRKSRFCIADFTGHRGGVYFEAGFAKGLGLEVIWTCRETDIEKSHFDTRQYNHIIWKDEKDLFGKLKRRIEATILS